MTNKSTAVPGRTLSAGPPRATPLPKTPPCHMQMHEGNLPANLPTLPSTRHRLMLPKEGDQYNPTICLDGNGDLRVVLRVHRGPKGTRTINFTGVVNKHWALEDAELMLSRREDGQLEDLRIFMWQDKLWATAVQYIDYSTQQSTIRQALLRLTPDAGEVIDTYIQPSPRNEKNWMPFVTVDGRLRLVYSTDPLIVLEADPEKAQVVPAVASITQVMSYIRGGTQLVPWRAGALAIVHQVYSPKVQTGGNPLLGDFWPAPLSPSYVHRFAYFDDELTDVKLSKPFRFLKPGIEFCAGLVRHDDRFIASVGIADREQWLFEIEDDTVDGFLGGLTGGAGI